MDEYLFMLCVVVVDVVAVVDLSARIAAFVVSLSLIRGPIPRKKKKDRCALRCTGRKEAIACFMFQHVYRLTWL